MLRSSIPESSATYWPGKGQVVGAPAGAEQRGAAEAAPPPGNPFSPAPAETRRRGPKGISTSLEVPPYLMDNIAEYLRANGGHNMRTLLFTGSTKLGIHVAPQDLYDNANADRDEQPTFLPCRYRARVRKPSVDLSQVGRVVLHRPAVELSEDTVESSEQAHRNSKSYGSYPVKTSEEANSRISNMFPSSFLAPFHSDKVENPGLSSIALIGVG